MPSFQDSAIIVILALLLFGPKGMAKLARELGKLMGEFRRASADFRFQMDEEFRASEQADQQKKIAAMEAAAPVPPVYQADIPDPEHPHLPAYQRSAESSAEPSVPLTEPAGDDYALPDQHVDHNIDRRRDVQFTPSEAASSAVLPIATSGNLNLMPPSTGLPSPRSGRASSVGSVFDSIPHKPDPETANNAALETETHG
jgi:sec-independent protein translocase protein TatB